MSENVSTRTSPGTSARNTPDSVILVVPEDPIDLTHLEEDDLVQMEDDLKNNNDPNNNFGDDGREDANNTVVILDNLDIGDVAKNVDGTDVGDDLHDLAQALR